MDKKNLRSLVKDAPILVVGDVMLDQYVYGDVTRISPESPVPVLSITRHTHMLGGAGNVIANLHGLGARPVLLSVVGDDPSANLVRGLLQNQNCDPHHLVVDKARPTPIKTRYVAQNQQLLRADLEQAHNLGADIEHDMIARAQDLIPTMRAVILSDYGKGCLTQPVIAAVIAAAKAHKIPVLVDPKGDDYRIYAGADIVTPNRKELAAATQNHATIEDADVVAACEKLMTQAGIGCVVATRSEAGMTVVPGVGKKPIHLRAKALEVFDVSGAGDTVIATIAASVAVGFDVVTAAQIANVAGGIVVAKIGTASIKIAELETALAQGDDDEISAASRPDPSPLHTHLQALVIRDWGDAREQIDRWRARGLKVGFTNGCFDILHAGHVNYLNGARMRCDRLVVGLNHDISVKLLKGPERPINPEDIRATVIGGLGSVDLVVFFGAKNAGDDNTATDLIRTLQPDIYFKGADYTIDQIPEAKIVQSYGGQVELVPLTQGLSTTTTLAKIKKAGAA